MKTPLTVSIDEQLVKDIKKEADSRRWSVSLLVRTAIEKYLRPDPPPEPLKRLGIK